LYNASELTSTPIGSTIIYDQTGRYPGGRKRPEENALVIKFQKWVDDIEKYGLEEVRKVRGWHDHTLKGDRAGQRAIYL
jgi:hypothetical protein